MAARVGLVAAAVAAIAVVLVRDPYSRVGPTLVALGVAFVAMFLLFFLEMRTSRLDRRVVLGAGGALLVMAVVVPPLQSRDLWSYAMYGRMVVHYRASPYDHE